MHWRSRAGARFDVDGSIIVLEDQDRGLWNRPMIAEGLVPQKRWGTAEDVGLAVSALLAGSFPFSTGDVINVDGGIHLQRL